MIDLMIAGLLGGYTVLSIKALSSLLKLNIYLMFTHWITYLMLFVLTATGVVRNISDYKLQIHFLNKALSNFDAVEVIPTNFVLFTTFSIVGSSVLYHDLSRTSPIALLGVIFMFLGVILITSKKADQYAPLEEEVSTSPLLSPNHDWRAYDEWSRSNQSVGPNSSINGDIGDPRGMISTGSTDFPYSSSSMPISFSSPARSYQKNRPPSTPLRQPRVSWDAGEGDRNAGTAIRRLSGILTTVGASVGTASVRKLEFDHLSELAHAATQQSRSSHDV
jgi:hypothetical protein